MLEVIQYLSIILEICIAVLGILLALKKKIYGWGIFLTFAIYVFYDFAKLTNMKINSDILSVLFFIATLSALLAVYKMYKK
jgi:hypothetical protein